MSDVLSKLQHNRPYFLIAYQIFLGRNSVSCRLIQSLRVAGHDLGDIQTVGKAPDIFSAFAEF